MAKTYDPVKAHDYYMRTRKLKGRKKAASAVGETLRTAGTKPPTSNSVQLQRQRQHAAEQVATLRKKLAELNRQLKERMAESRKSAKEAAKPDTAAEKAQKARDAKKYRDKNKQKLKTKAATDRSKSGGGSSKSGSKSSTGKDSVEELKAAVDRVQSALKKAVARKRALG